MGDHFLMRSAVFIELLSLRWDGSDGVRGVGPSRIRRQYAVAHLRDIAKSSGQ
jgi:hypothetical protein